MPDVTRRMYTPEEMGAPVLVSESGDVVIDAEATDITDEPTTGAEEASTKKKANGDPPRPWEPDLLKAKMLIAVGKKANATGKPSQGQIGLLAGKLEEAWPGDKGAADNRHEVLGWLTGQRSAKDLTLGWVATLLNWLLANDGETFNEHSREEARLVYKRAMLDQGQQEMPLDESAKTPEQHLDDTFGNVEEE